MSAPEVPETTATTPVEVASDQRPVFEVFAKRAGEFWGLMAPEVPGAVSVVRRLSAAERHIREAITFVAGIDPDSFDVVIRTVVSEDPIPGSASTPVEAFVHQVADHCIHCPSMCSRVHTEICGGEDCGSGDDVDCATTDVERIDTTRIRARHQASPIPDYSPYYCAYCTDDKWPCDTRLLCDALDVAKAEVERLGAHGGECGECDGWHGCCEAVDEVQAEAVLEAIAAMCRRRDDCNPGPGPTWILADEIREELRRRGTSRPTEEGEKLSLGPRHALYVGWVLGAALRNGIDATPVVDEAGDYTDRIEIHGAFHSRQADQVTFAVVVPPPPDDWPELEQE